MKRLWTFSAVVSSICSATPALAGDAKNCVVWDAVSAAQAKFSSPAQRMTNACNEEIYVMYCHDPASQRGTKESECGQDGKYFQRFRTLAPGASHDNHYSMPPGARMHWGACTGRRALQTGDGGYSCK
jgi:hypothetical protein